MCTNPESRLPVLVQHLQVAIGGYSRAADCQLASRPKSAAAQLPASTGLSPSRSARLARRPMAAAAGNQRDGWSVVGASFVFHFTCLGQHMHPRAH